MSEGVCWSWESKQANENGVDWSSTKTGCIEHESRFVDSETGAIAAAQIKDFGDKSDDNVALLGATFNRVFFDTVNSSQSWSSNLNCLCSDLIVTLIVWFELASNVTMKFEGAYVLLHMIPCFILYSESYLHVW